MNKKSMDELFDKFDEIIPKLKAENFDMMIAINRGGVIPAGIINQTLNLPLHIININFRDDNHTPRFDEPKMIENFNLGVTGKVLLIDDVCRSGKTIELAKKQIGKNIKTLVVNGKADYSLYDGECFLMPWAIK